MRFTKVPLVFAVGARIDGRVFSSIYVNAATAVSRKDMTMRKLTTTLALAVAMTALPSLAQADELSRLDDPDQAFRVGETNRYHFDDDHVDGEVLRAEGTLIAGRGAARHASLVSIRANFIDQLYKLALDAPI